MSGIITSENIAFYDHELCLLQHAWVENHGDTGITIMYFTLVKNKH